MRQKMLTKQILFKIPPTGSNSNNKDPIIYLKLFCPWGSATWYIAELDSDQDYAFGYVTGLFEDEWGYVSLKELQAIQGPYGLYIERDKWFTPTRFSELKLKEKTNE